MKTCTVVLVVLLTGCDNTIKTIKAFDVPGMNTVTYGQLLDDRKICESTKWRMGKHVVEYRCRLKQGDENAYYSEFQEIRIRQLAMNDYLSNPRYHPLIEDNGYIEETPREKEAAAVKYADEQVNYYRLTAPIARDEVFIWERNKRREPYTLTNTYTEITWYGNQQERTPLCLSTIHYANLKGINNADAYFSVRLSEITIEGETFPPCY